MRTFFKDYLTPLAMLALAAVVGYDHFSPGRDAAPAVAVVDPVKLGREYAPALPAALAEGWDAAAQAIEGGKSVADAQAALQAKFADARVAAFTAKVAPSFARVLPEGTEPRDSAHRAEVGNLFRGFARGLRGGK